MVGATGLNMRTGEFYVFKAKATILATATPTGMWIFSTELDRLRRTATSTTPATARPWPGRPAPS